MRKREKADFLLEQVRLCLAKRDFVRATIIRNKITKKIIVDVCYMLYVIAVSNHFINTYFSNYFFANIF